MAKTQYLTYYIHLTDQAVVDAQNALYGSGALMSPDVAATTYGAPVQAESPLSPIVAPCIRSPWFQSTFNYPRNVTYFTRKSGGWFGISFLFGTTTKYWWRATFVYTPAGTAPTTDPADDGATTLPASSIPQRRHIDGFAFPGPPGVAASTGEAGTTAARAMISRAASRLPGGYGLALRGDQGRYTKLVMSMQGGGASTYRSSWERFYIRRRTNGAGFVWSAIDNAARGFFLQVLSGGGAIVHDGTSGTPNPIGTFSLCPVIDRWYKVDLIFRWGDFGSADNFGNFRAWVDGVKVLEVDPTGLGGINGGAGKRHEQTDFGFGGTNESDFSVDISDWINADPPGVGYTSNLVVAVNDRVFYNDRWYVAAAITGPGTGNGVVVPGTNPAMWTRVAPPLDWSNGTHLQVVKPTVAAVGDAGWINEVSWLAQRPNPSTAAHLAGRTSIIGGAVCQVSTDFAESVLQLPGSLGVVPCFLVATHSNRGNLLNGSLGYKINALAPVTAVITQTAAVAWARVMFRPVATSTPLAITSLELSLTKGAEANIATCNSLMALVEVIGNFGACDAPYGNNLLVPAVTELPPDLKAVTHNQHIPRSQWVRSQTAPISPVAVVGGLYTGTGTFKDLPFLVAPHFLFIRPVTGSADTGGVRWWPSMLGPHANISEGTAASLLVDELENTAFGPAVAEDQQEQQFLARITGNIGQTNVLASTYQYIAIGDPGMRFLCSGAGAQDQQVVTPTQAAVKLDNASFLPTFGFFQAENAGSGAITASLFFRGPGHTANQVAASQAAVIANGANFAVGGINFISSGMVSPDGLPFACLAFRTDDGSTDTGKNKVVQCATWTGNGAGSRDIIIPGATGRRPMFVMVFPNDNGGMHYRDPSHTGVNASRYDGAGIANAITAGAVDQFTVGAACNVNLVVYHAFIVIGGTTAGNGGWGINEALYPVEPDSPVDGPWQAPPDPADQGFDENGNPIVVVSALAGEPDLEAVTNILTSAASIGGLLGGNPCETYTRALVNIALSHLEISKVVGNLATEQSEIAALARRHVKEDINTVLRAWPWDFATRYANLVLVAGSETAPVNNDWVYSYRAPNTIVTARRISKLYAGRTFDPTPIPFRLAQDASGLLVYCNTLATATVPLTLEYTYRNECPSFWGDPLFREALTWKFAASLSPLARDGKKKEFCLQMFRDIVGRGQTVDANEQQQEPNGDADWITGRQ